ncbi:hypothetical protein [Leptothrix ochracea]|uniref:hypothetical protein n=1 Tax=Leptothrix ochracea TaxID=735331 RepID=UPI0034E2D0DC
MNNVEYQSVAVIFEIDARDKIMKLAAVMPVWAAESPVNANAIADARQQYLSPLTIFFVRLGESRIDMCSRILYDIDAHHQCDTFDLYGMSASDVDPVVLTELKIHRVRNTEYGCQLAR